MKIVILGGRGFLGSNLATLFEVEGHEIKSLVKKEFQDMKLLTQLLISTDVVINCIGSANVGYSYTNVELDFDSNVGVVRRVLELLRKEDLVNVKFINVSSAAVYGSPINLPVKESDPVQPLSPYGFHKYMAELLLKEYSQCFGLKTISIRLFSAYGVGQKKLLLWDIHQKILKSNKSVILHGTGDESRDFIHIEDIAQQVSIVIHKAVFQGQPINVANGCEIKISEIVELYQKYYPKKFDYEFNRIVRLGDPLNWCADISWMKTNGYQMKFGIEEGVKHYINHINESNF